MVARTVVKAACPHDCPDTCAMEIAVEDGIAVEVRGADMPFTDGTLLNRLEDAMLETAMAKSEPRSLVPAGMRGFTNLSGTQGVNPLPATPALPFAGAKQPLPAPPPPAPT